MDRSKTPVVAGSLLLGGLLLALWLGTKLVESNEGEAQERLRVPASEFDKNSSNRAAALSSAETPVSLSAGRAPASVALPGLSITGSVYSPVGDDKIPGATVRLVASRRTAAGPGASTAHTTPTRAVLARTESDSSGTYALEIAADDHAEHAGAIWLEAEAGESYHALVKVAESTARSEIQQDLRLSEIGGAGSIEVRLTLLPDVGVEIPGTALVFLEGPMGRFASEVVTIESNQAQFALEREDLRQPGGIVCVELEGLGVFRGGYVDLGAVRPDAIVAVSCSIQALMELHLDARDVSGNPVSNATVQCLTCANAGLLNAITSQEGSASLRVPANFDPNWILRCEHPRFVTSCITFAELGLVPNLGGQQVGLVTLAPGASVSGSILGHEGVDWNSIVVRFKPTGSTALYAPLCTARTSLLASVSPSGTYRLERIPTGEYACGIFQTGATHEGSEGSRSEIQTLVLANGDIVEGLDFQLASTSAAELSGTLHWEGMRAGTRVLVELVRISEGGVPYAWDQAASQVQGRVRVAVGQAWKLPFTPDAGAQFLLRASLDESGFFERLIVLNGDRPRVDVRVRKDNLKELMPDERGWKLFPTEEARAKYRQRVLDAQASAATAPALHSR